MKPDNILVDWEYDNTGYGSVTRTALGDFDTAIKLQNTKPLCTRYALGNVMWRSPEGQTGRGITKASDVYSFGLVVGLLCLHHNERISSIYSNMRRSAYMLLEPENY